MDTDFDYLRRHEVIEYVTEKYGAAQVAQIATFGTLSTKSALKDIGRALGIHHEIINDMNKLVPSHNGEVMPISDCLVEIPEFKEFQEKYPRLFELALEIEAMPRTQGTHACGVLICDEPITNEVSLIRGKDDGDRVAAYDGPTLEKNGFIKFDFLGLKNLSVIELCRRMIEDRHGYLIDVDNLEPDDKSPQDLAAFRMIQAGETDALFQIESPGMKQMFNGMNTVDFNDLIAGVALYRPGPMAHIPTYNARKNGVEEVEYPCAELEEICANTFGLLVYQEQIMTLTGKLGGYSLGEQDGFRKAIGKKSQEVMDKELPKLEEAILNNGYSQEVTNWCIEAIKPFIGYGFNKSHAAAYAYIAYQTAYLKANYPLEYMTAVLQVFYTDGSKVVKYTKVARDMGFDVLQPDINRSEEGFRIDGTNTIRFGFGAIKGLGKASITAILDERKNGEFTSIRDLIERVPKKSLNKKALAALCYSGAFDSLMTEEFTNRPQFLMHIQKDIRLDGTDEKLVNEIATYTDRAKYEKEFETLGLYISGHILDRYAEPTEWEELDESTHHTVVLLTEVKRIITKKGDPMAFLTVDTLEGTKDLTLFPKQYASVPPEGLVPGMLAKVGIKGQMNWQKNQKDFIVSQINIPKKINERMWKEIKKKQETVA